MNAAYRLAALYCDQGRWDEAAECLAYGRDVARSDARSSTATFRLAAEARLAAHRGELAEALTLAQRAVERAERSDMLNLRARAWLALAEVQRARGATAEADAAVADGGPALRGEGERRRGRRVWLARRFVTVSSGTRCRCAAPRARAGSCRRGRARTG